MGFILSILAMALLLLVHIVDYIVSCFYDVKNRKWFKLVDKRNFNKAMAIDIFGNYQYADFWNLLLSKKGDNYKFGRKGETLSSCFGKKQVECSLSWIGWLFLAIINTIDFTKWFKGGHCYAAIMLDDEINKKHDTN